MPAFGRYVSPARLDVCGEGDLSADVTHESFDGAELAGLFYSNLGWSGSLPRSETIAFSRLPGPRRESGLGVETAGCYTGAAVPAQPPVSGGRNRHGMWGYLRGDR